MNLFRTVIGGAYAQAMLTNRRERGAASEQADLMACAGQGSREQAADGAGSDEGGGGHGRRDEKSRIVKCGVVERRGAGRIKIIRKRVMRRQIRETSGGRSAKLADFAKHGVCHAERRFAAGRPDALTGLIGQVRRFGFGTTHIRGVTITDRYPSIDARREDGEIGRRTRFRS
jgi:hypothetical protein